MGRLEELQRVVKEDGVLRECVVCNAWSCVPGMHCPHCDQVFLDDDRDRLKL